MKVIFSFVLLTTAMGSPSWTYAQTDSAVSVAGISKAELQRAAQDIYATPPSLPLITPGSQAHSGAIWLRSR